MDREVHDIRIAQWKKILQNANESGMKKTEWCAAHGISRKQFYYWQRKVRKSLIEEAVKNGEWQPQLPGFAELEIPCAEADDNEMEELSESRAESMGMQPEIVIKTAGCSIYLSSQVTERKLATVLKVIRNA